MSSDAEKRKVVQTEVPLEEYERLRRVAEEEGIPIKQALRRAAREYSDRHLQYDPDDPLFAVEPGTGDRETDARETDERLADALASRTDE